MGLFGAIRAMKKAGRTTTYPCAECGIKVEVDNSGTSIFGPVFCDRHTSPLTERMLEIGRREMNKHMEEFEKNSE